MFGLWFDQGGLGGALGVECCVPVGENWMELTGLVLFSSSGSCINFLCVEEY